jgi:hypothetical protein
MESPYYQKYLKYKMKYTKLVGGSIHDINISDTTLNTLFSLQNGEILEYMPYFFGSTTYEISENKNTRNIPIQARYHFVKTDSNSIIDSMMDMIKRKAYFKLLNNTELMLRLNSKFKKITGMGVIEEKELDRTDINKLLGSMSCITLKNSNNSNGLLELAKKLSDIENNLMNAVSGTPLEFKYDRETNFNRYKSDCPKDIVTLFRKKYDDIKDKINRKGELDSFIKTIKTNEEFIKNSVDYEEKSKKLEDLLKKIEYTEMEHIINVLNGIIFAKKELIPNMGTFTKERESYVKKKIMPSILSEKEVKNFVENRIKKYNPDVSDEYLSYILEVFYNMIETNIIYSKSISTQNPVLDLLFNIKNGIPGFEEYYDVKYKIESSRKVISELDKSMAEMEKCSSEFDKIVEIMLKEEKPATYFIILFDKNYLVFRKNDMVREKFDLVKLYKNGTVNPGYMYYGYRNDIIRGDILSGKEKLKTEMLPDGEYYRLVMPENESKVVIGGDKLGLYKILSSSNFVYYVPLKEGKYNGLKLIPGKVYLVIFNSENDKYLYVVEAFNINQSSLANDIIEYTVGLKDSEKKGKFLDIPNPEKYISKYKVTCSSIIGFNEKCQVIKQ